MCGITGIYAFNEIGRVYGINLQKAINSLEKRGPDQRGTLRKDMLSLGHTRLSIIDTSNAGKQPMSDESDKHHIAFNGEIYNYKELKREIPTGKYSFKSETDTEVLLHLLEIMNVDAIPLLNGFFSFAYYDSEKQELLLARDRYGIKPLYFYQDHDKFIFGSELKSILAYNLAEKEIDPMALAAYLRFNYIPAPNSIYKGIHKLMPGEWIKIGPKREIKRGHYYKLPSPGNTDKFQGTYEEASEEIRKLLSASIERRLVADVPLGSFLSGGLDSSIIAAKAAQMKPDLQTFSISFPDHPFFDERKYADILAKHIGSKHEVIEIRDSEMLEDLYSSLDYFSEPFADSSSIAYYSLSKRTRKELTVALSGDGADELFGGYMKHQAWQMIALGDSKVNISKMLLPFLQVLPSSRTGSFSNTVRRMRKLGENARMKNFQRYFSMCSISKTQDALELMHADLRKKMHNDVDEYFASQGGLKRDPKDLNEALFNDLKFVLPNDMLMKVDHASMANSLEVRVPFLDHELINFVQTLPSEWKADKSGRKKILKDSFKDILPSEILTRSKKGFEVPLQAWLRKELKSDLDKTLFNEERIRETGILNWNTLKRLKERLNSSNPGDSAAQVWALFCLMKKID